MKATQMERTTGIAMIFVVIISIALFAMAAASLQMTLVHSVAQSVELEAFQARQIADSGASQALARIKEAGVMTPMSGGGSTSLWVNFGSGQYYYSTTFDPANNVSTIRGWGRVAADPNPSTCTSSPDSPTWDETGWMVQGIEISVRSVRYVPESPLYFGNGGVERPLGGFDWAAGVDPTDPSTWVPILSGPSSYQSASIPFQASALDYPPDYLYSGGSPAPASTNPHPYQIWATQNPIGQFNVEAWFKNSAGAGLDPTVNVTPAPTASYFDVSDKTSPDYPYPVDPSLPDVQDFALQLWNTYKNDGTAPKLGSGSSSGTYGTFTAPAVTFVTGSLLVSEDTTFKGCGILVIRDDYDPNTQTNNTPSTRARLEVRGRFQWTGLVIVAGWAPDIIVADESGAEATIVGALFGEDSVQSGGEISLDSATIITQIRHPFRILYSNALFRPGGLLYNYLPLVKKEVVGIRRI